MKIAFFISSAGDTDLALSTIKSIEQKGPHETILIALTKTAQERIQQFSTPSLRAKTSLIEILKSDTHTFSESQRCTESELNYIRQYIDNEAINYAYFGVPSASNEIPFQIAASIKNIPVLIAYEFMYKPEEHCLWEYVQTLKSQDNIEWAVVSDKAKEDIKIDDDNKVHTVGHMSIDKAFSSIPLESATIESIRQRLNVDVSKDEELVFLSGTTQPLGVDANFLDCLLSELIKYPTMQIRFGVHPGTNHLARYISEILSIYEKHPAIHSQFKIILSKDLSDKFRALELSIDDPRFQSAFIEVNINGPEASAAAHRVTQAVLGAQPNQAAIQGTPSYAHSVEKPYLKSEFYAANLSAFFSNIPKRALTRDELGLDSQTAPERCAEIIIRPRLN